MNSASLRALQIIAIVSPFLVGLLMYLVFGFLNPEEYNNPMREQGLQVAGILWLVGLGNGLLVLIISLCARRKIKGYGFAVIALNLSELWVPNYLLWATVEQVRTNSGRMVTAGKLKAIALAMHEYADKHGALPPPAIHDKNGKPLLSWRVAAPLFGRRQHLCRTPT
jgi:hypothetical protein